MIIFVIFYILPMLISFWIANQNYKNLRIDFSHMTYYAIISIMPIINIVALISLLEEYIHERRNE